MRAEALRERLGAAGELVRWPDGVPGEIGKVATDSRQVGAGDLFVAYQGTSVDAHGFLPQVSQAGAAAAMVERAVGGVTIPLIEVKNGRHAAALAAALQFGDPSSGLTLLAVTGTNGKTTTVHILRHLFGREAPAGSIGTLGALDGDGRVLPDTENLTTPGPVELMATLAALKSRGVRTVALEASSHSLDQDRLYGLHFQATVFTNLTRDHLDYHQTLDAYLTAKLRLVLGLAKDGWAVTNADDRAWDKLAAGHSRLTFGITQPADVRATDIAGDARGMRFQVTARGQSARMTLPLIGRFNVENALGAAAAALALGQDLGAVAERLVTTPQVPGRMERVAERPCVVVRDYAHTPDALERALAAVRPLTRGRVIAVFGCGGDRDRGKRPVMGALAARDADLAILTSDNPRTEDPERILDDVEEGMGETPHLRIVDRRAAIARAVVIARPDDTVLLAGKGHENYQVVGKEKLPFDEREVVDAAVKALLK
ncbi:MAG: UDP-N-acetylmuramoyl-L-alanyl-D-glutamate--2,6-diaminopimelate ligase [Gemmatimonadales bacterium]